MFYFQNLTAELFLLESPDDSYFPKSGGSTFLKTVGSHFSEICGNKVTAYTLTHGKWYLGRSTGGYYILPEYRAGVDFQRHFTDTVASQMHISPHRSLRSAS